MGNPNQKIHTAVLDLEPILPSHAKPLFESLQAPDLYSFIPQNPPTSEEKLREKYSRWAERQSSDGLQIWLNYAMYHRVICQYVGTLQATIISEEKAYIAYEVFQPFRKQGVAKEGTLALIEELFVKFDIPTIIAHVDTRNEASIRLLTSLGFFRTETILSADYFKGHSSDEFVYRIIR